MRKWIFPFGFLFFSLMFQEAFSQEIPESIDNKPVTHSGFYLGGQATTNGLGLNFGYNIKNRLTVKTGVESLNYTYSFLLDESNVSYNTKFNYKTGGIFLLADYFYTRILYITGGVMMNDFQPELNGMAVSDLKYGDIIIPASKVGGFSFLFEPELKFSPYLGAGVRKFSGKSQFVSWTFETGLYYIGPPKISIETTGLLSPTSDPAHGQQKYLEQHFSAYKYYPVVKFGVAVRLF